jgi:hypothetical protein
MTGKRGAHAEAQSFLLGRRNFLPSQTSGCQIEAFHGIVFFLFPLCVSAPLRETFLASDFGVFAYGGGGEKGGIKTVTG